MWLYYLIGVVGLSIATSTISVSDTSENIRDAIRKNEPATLAKSTLMIARVLRRQFTLDSDYFYRQALNNKIPTGKIKRLLPESYKIPEDVTFWISNVGYITYTYNGEEGDLNTIRFEAEIERLAEDGQ